MNKPNAMPQLTHEPVKSGNVRSVGYDPEQQHLQVAFHSGETYDYIGVPPATHQAFMGSKSKGKFLAEGIKTRFRHIKRHAP